MSDSDGRTIPTPPLVLQIEEPQGADWTVYQEIKRQAAFPFLTNGDCGDSNRPMPLAMAKLLATHPRSGFAEALTRGLRKSYFKRNSTEDRREREWLWHLIGEPDEKDYPRPWGLEEATIVRVPGEWVKPGEENTWWELMDPSQRSCSPFFLIEQERLLAELDYRRRQRRTAPNVSAEGLPDAWERHGWGYDSANGFPVAWARRGAGYYCYSETLATPAVRNVLDKLLKPLPLLFPRDRRLDVKVVADAPERVPLDVVIASYARQSGVPLQASPFFAHCFQSGGKQTNMLCTEMAFLERTFKARWVPRGEGYFLDAGDGSDAEVGQAARGLKPEHVAVALLLIVAVPVFWSTFKLGLQRG